MTEHQAVPPELLRRVLEALLDFANDAWLCAEDDSVTGACAKQLKDACTAALAAASGPDAGTGERELCGSCCEVCDGVGFTVDLQHADDCDGTCRNCPVAVQTQCERCAPASGAAPEEPIWDAKTPDPEAENDPSLSDEEWAKVEAEMDAERAAAPEEREVEMDWMDDPILRHVERMENLVRGFMNHHITTAMLLEGKQRIAEDLNAAVTQRARAAREAGRAEMGEVVGSGTVTGRSWEGGPVLRFTRLTLSVADASALPLGTPVDLVRRRGKEEG